MTSLEALLVLATGFGAGVLSSTVGVASLLSFPVLVAIGLPPVVANVSNTLGLIPGGLSGVLGYRTEVREAGPIFVTMTEMFDVADAFCRAERLLSMARTPRQRALHNWLLGELVHQLDGSAAQPWDGDAGSASPSTSRVG